MVKLRLQRHGRKGQPFYYIVAADARAPRDGRYIERIGSYNPNTNPATIDLNLDDAVRWLGNGAVPTDTCRAILSYKGAMYKNHLNRGVAKGAMTQEAADSKFAAWLEEKQNKVQAKREGLLQSATEAAAENLKREEAARAAKEKAIVEKNSPVAEEVAEVEADPETSGEAEEVVVSEETPAEEVAASEEAPAEKVDPETSGEGEAEVVAEEATETPIETEAEVEAEVETPAEEVVASEETPAEDAGEKEDDSEEKTA